MPTFFLNLNLLNILYCLSLTLLKLVTHHLCFSEFPYQFLYLIKIAKDAFVFIYFGLVVFLLHFYSHAEWMSLAATSLIFQVGLINIFLFLFKYLKKSKNVD